MKSECENCGEMFDANSRRAKYCSSTCRQQAYRSRQDETDPDDEFDDHENGYDSQDEIDHEAERRDWETSWNEDPETDNDHPQEGKAKYRNGNDTDGDHNRNSNHNDDDHNRNKNDTDDDHKRNKTVEIARNNRHSYSENTSSYSKNDDHDRNNLPVNDDDDDDDDEDDEDEDEDVEKRRYPSEFYTSNGALTAQALAKLSRLDLLSRKHKPNYYSDEVWFEYAVNSYGVPLDIYSEALVELEQEEQNEAIAEMNARIVRWFSKLVDFALMDKFKLKDLKALLKKIRLYTRTNRFRKIPADNDLRIEFLNVLDSFSEAAQQLKGYKPPKIRADDAFLDRMENIIEAARNG
jgi:hypothetical protein